MRPLEYIISRATDNYADNILNDHLFQSKINCTFQYLVALYNQHKSRSVDDAVMFYITDKIVDTMILKCQIANEINRDQSVTIESLIKCETEIYKIKFLSILSSCDLILKIKNQKFNRSSQEKQSKIKPQELRYTTICASTYSDIFNWDKRAINIESADLGIEKSNEQNINIYNSVLDHLKDLDWLFCDELKSDILTNLDDMLTAFVRYELYRHASSHTFCDKYSKFTAEIYSGIFANNLHKRFLESGSCSGVSMIEEEDNDLTID